MDWHADRDADLTKGAVEAAMDRLDAPRDEQGLPAGVIALTEDIIDAGPTEIHEAAHILGADENGTPG